jgi:hypothetical protein
MRLIASQNDELKSQIGGFVMWAWLISGAVLFYREPEARLISWQALIYFLVGTLIAIGAFGLLLYGIGVGLARLSVKLRFQLSKPVPPAVKVTNVFLRAGLAILIYFVARWTIRAML